MKSKPHLTISQSVNITGSSSVCKPGMLEPCSSQETHLLFDPAGTVCIALILYEVQFLLTIYWPHFYHISLHHQTWDANDHWNRLRLRRGSVDFSRSHGGLCYEFWIWSQVQALSFPRVSMIVPEQRNTGSGKLCGPRRISIAILHSPAPSHASLTGSLICQGWPVIFHVPVPPSWERGL